MHFIPRTLLFIPDGCCDVSSIIKAQWFIVSLPVKHRLIQNYAHCDDTLPYQNITTFAVFPL